MQCTAPPRSSGPLSGLHACDTCDTPFYASAPEEPAPAAPTSEPPSPPSAGASSSALPPIPSVPIGMTHAEALAVNLTECLDSATARALGLLPEGTTLKGLPAEEAEIVLAVAKVREMGRAGGMGIARAASDRASGKGGVCVGVEGRMGQTCA